jgi:hypothetical protein
MSTAKELAETAAGAALDSLRATLKTEVDARAKLRRARTEGWSGLTEQHEVKETERRTDAALVAWRKAEEAVPR